MTVRSEIGGGAAPGVPAGGPPYRVAHVIGELGKGGCEYQLHELLRGLDRSRFAAEVIVLAAGGYWAGPIRTLGVPLIEVPRTSGFDPLRLVRLRRLLRAFRPHVLHTTRWSGNSYGRLAALGLGIPVVIASERVHEHERPAWKVATDRLLDRVTDAYIVNSEAIAAGLVARERVAREKITVVPNGVDVRALPPFAVERQERRRAAGFDPDRRLIAQVGRLTAQKDHPTFLRAAAAVASEVPDVDFLVVGQGEERAALEALAAELGLGARLRFMGLRHDVPELLGAVDVLALTSTFEGLPNVLLEALSAGAVAVATDVGGCPEVIVPEETGILVPPGDPAAVAAAILRVLRDPALARRLALAGRRRVETEFTIERLAERTMATYQELLAARGVGRAAAAAA
jgi:glycosyltransferase involved in cell wall biosynthesis